MLKIIQVPSQLVGATPLADNGMSLRFHTKELTSKEKLVIMDSFQRAGWLLFKEDKAEFSELDIPKENSGYDEPKTPSMRLRAVLFRWWEQSPETTRGDFENFYRRKMEKIIEQLKEKLS
jgi:hypothetical protein